MPNTWRMPYLQLAIPCTEAEQPRVERALEDVGALAVTLQDAHLDAADEQAIFEPGVGEIPLWREMTLTALFDADTDALVLLAALEAFDPGLDWTQARFEKVEDQDWERAWLDQFQPMRFGARTWIVPWNHDLPDDAKADEAAIVRLDPGLAFGSGTHPTTALCLEWLDGLELEGKAVIDYGCGSGVLAIAALKLGAACAFGIDNDPQALTATRDNAARNGAADKLQVCLPSELPSDVLADVFVANILAGPLGELAPRFASLCKPGAPFALSGILAGQEDELLDRYRDCGFANLRVTGRDGWVRIDGVRH